MVEIGEVRWYVAADGAPIDDVSTNIGGAVDKTHKASFVDLSAPMTVQIVSSAPTGDTTQTVQVYYRNTAGSILNETQTLNGQTPVVFAATMERLMRGIKSASTNGDVAVEASTAEFTGTAVTGGSRTVTLPSGASAVDDAYQFMVARLGPTGTGSGQIREIVKYTGSSRLAEVDRPWTTVPDGTTGVRISRGMYFEKLPNEVLKVTRLHYDSLAEPSDGADRQYYAKVFAFNTQPATGAALTNAIVRESSDVLTLFAFAVEATLDGSTRNGSGNNRQVAPTGFSFDSADKDVANSKVLSPNTGQGVWIRLTRLKGAPAVKTVLGMLVRGNTV